MNSILDSRQAANIRGRINFDGFGFFGTMDGNPMPEVISAFYSSQFSGGSDLLFGFDCVSGRVVSCDEGDGVVQLSCALQCRGTILSCVPFDSSLNFFRPNISPFLICFDLGVARTAELT